MVGTMKYTISVEQMFSTDETSLSPQQLIEVVRLGLNKASIDNNIGIERDNTYILVTDESGNEYGD